MQAFSLDQEAEYVAFFQKYGIVVIKNVISDEEADKSAKEVWHFLQQNFGCEMDKPETWQKWPWGSHLGTPILYKLTCAGILGSAFAMSLQACQNRQNANIHKVFATLFQTPQLYVSHDRYGMMRPTKNVPFATGAKDMEEWKSTPDYQWRMTIL